jgi:hypothetical protein
MGVVGVVGREMRGRESECSVSQLFLKTYICVLTFSLSFIQLKSRYNGSIPQPSAWLSVLDRAIM